MKSSCLNRSIAWETFSRRPNNTAYQDYRGLRFEEEEGEGWLQLRGDDQKS
jgi:hypothetical protein